MNTQVPQSLLEKYVVANTPAFLFKSLRSDAFVKGLQSKGKDELQKYFEKGNKEERDIQDIVYAYCALIALFLSDDSSGSENFEVAERSRLSWALPILTLSKSFNKKNNFSELSAPRIIDTSIFGSHRGSSFNTINLKS